MNNKFIIFSMILIIIFTVSSLVFVAYAEPGEKSTQGKYTNHIKEYYDNRMAQYGTLLPLEPVIYSSFYIEPIKSVQCDSWTPVYGLVPESGLLVFTVFSGDFIGYSNVSHMEQFWLINYFYLPCEGVEDFGQINITYIWNDNTDKEFAPNTKVRDMGIDRHYLQLTQIFEIN